MSMLSELLPPANVLINVEVGSVKKLFELMGIFFENRFGVPKDVVYPALFERERLGSTLIADGCEWAIPHAVIASISEILCGLVRLKDPVIFDRRGRYASFFLFVLTPPTCSDKTSSIYKEWSMLSNRKDVIKTAQIIDDPSALYQYLFHFCCYD
ncbi:MULTISPECIES: PTS sugar transporter subunit IIA [Candidatus Ichthyocystis]|uniref:PTS sugar transporter subunit IIA n=1 Tax=Candidatus Ichthyocystis TaxID=2929841 RepID=UPI000B812FDA|nr:MULTISPECIES: PTS sugar transporter subunit IIA [Ichthyocystis]